MLEEPRSAQILRDRMRDMNRKVSAVTLLDDKVVASFAEGPATVIIVQSVGPHVVLRASLLGILGLL